MNTLTKNSGRRYTHTAGTAAISAGAVVEVATGTAGMIGVAVADIAAAGSGELETEGVHALPKATTTASALAAGTLVYFDGTNILATASTNTRAGRVWAAAGASDATVEVKLNAM